MKTNVKRVMSLLMTVVALSLIASLAGTPVAQAGNHVMTKCNWQCESTAGDNCAEDCTGTATFKVCETATGQSCTSTVYSGECGYDPTNNDKPCSKVAC